MDTVYNNETTGPFMQTFKFIPSGILFVLYQTEKTSTAMKNGVDTLENLLGNDAVKKYVNVLLTYRGSEFYSAMDMETGVDGTTRTRVFYCDPMQSGRKGSIENNNIQLRYILPKQTDLVSLGLTDQGALNLVLSHINSAPVENLVVKVL